MFLSTSCQFVFAFSLVFIWNLNMDGSDDSIVLAYKSLAYDIQQLSL